MFNLDAWVDLLGQASPIYANSPRRVTPVPFGGEQVEFSSFLAWLYYVLTSITIW